MLCPPPPPIQDLEFGHSQNPVWIQRGDRGSGPPEKSQKYRVSYQYWSGSTKYHKATKPAFNGGPLSSRQQNAISMAFRWWVDGGPFLVALRSSLTTPSDNMFWIRACMQCVWTGSIEIKLSTDIMSWYFGTLIQHATKTQTSLCKCAFSIQHWWLRYVKHHRFYVEWINFVSHDSNHNLERPFCIQVWKANLPSKFTQLFNTMVCMAFLKIITSTVTCK